MDDPRLRMWVFFPVPCGSCNPLGTSFGSSPTTFPDQIGRCGGNIGANNGRKTVRISLQQKFLMGRDFPTIRKPSHWNELRYREGKLSGASAARKSKNTGERELCLYGVGVSFGDGTFGERTDLGLGIRKICLHRTFYDVLPAGCMCGWSVNPVVGIGVDDLSKNNSLPYISKIDVVVSRRSRNLAAKQFPFEIKHP